MKRRAVSIILMTVAAALWLAPALQAGRDGGKEAPEKPETPAERVAGRWKITLDGLPDDHEPILASLAVEGELLIGTLTVGRQTVPIHSGRIVGDSFKFSFRHVSGDSFVMQGSHTLRGLVGTWEGGRLSGRWTARPLGG